MPFSSSGGKKAPEDGLGTISRVNQPQYHLRDTWPQEEEVAEGGGFPLATPGVLHPRLTSLPGR